MTYGVRPGERDRLDLGVMADDWVPCRDGVAGVGEIPELDGAFLGADGNGPGVEADRRCAVGAERYPRVGGHRRGESAGYPRVSAVPEAEGAVAAGDHQGVPGSGRDGVEHATGGASDGRAWERPAAQDTVRGGRGGCVAGAKEHGDDLGRMRQ
jgi:hypothetical protein